MSKRSRIKSLEDCLEVAEAELKAQSLTIHALEDERRELKAFKKRVLQAVEPRRIAAAPSTTWSADPAYVRMQVDL